MNRREFIGAMGAAAVTAATGAPKGDSNIKLSETWLNDILLPPADRSYTLFVHPDSLTGFVSITARGRWREAHRAWREDGKPLMSPQQLFSKYAYQPPKLTGEIGSIESFRFIRSPIPPGLLSA